ncbi:hypothetical protein [uncultured Maribacter sp.]|uniref:hypothetical protein n=1 Tax=uncultured Maribacter sp. TaxID=431308 RepID=UPI00262CDF6B|nr:hypothetical protein [uncultured Maribacter sp.]
MRNLIILLTLFLAQLSSGQVQQVSESYLIGSWIVDHKIQEGDTETTVYRRCTTVQIGSVLRFLTTDEYRISFNSGRKIGRRCGNDFRRRVINGYYRFNSQEQIVTLESYNTDPVIYWEVMWINENSFAVKKSTRQ